MKLNKKKITAIVVGILIATGVIIIKNKKTALSKIPPMKAYAVVAETIKVKTQNEQLTVPYLATVMSDQSVTVSSRSALRVVQMVKGGTKVMKGDIVVKLDDRDLQDKKYSVMLQVDSTKTELSAKKVALNNAQATHHRTLALLRVKGASVEMSQREESTIKGLEAAVRSLQNKIKILNRNLSEIKTALSYTILKAPQTGRVSKTFLNVGEMAMPGKPLLHIVSGEEKYLLVRTANRKHGEACLFEGKKYTLTPLNSTFNGLYEYRAEVQTKHAVGEKVDIDLVTYDAKGLKVPINTLLQTDGKNYCFVVHGNKAHAAKVNIVSRGEHAVIIKGLKEKSEIVVAKPDILLQLLAGKSVAVQNK